MYIPRERKKLADSARKSDARCNVLEHAGERKKHFFLGTQSCLYKDIINVLSLSTLGYEYYDY